jgi:hypothetical protein
MLYQLPDGGSWIRPEDVTRVSVRYESEKRYDIKEEDKTYYVRIDFGEGHTDLTPPGGREGCIELRDKIARDINKSLMDTIALGR